MENFFFYFYRSFKQETIQIKTDIPHIMFHAQKNEQYLNLLAFYCDDDLLHIIDIEVDNVTQYCLYIANKKLFMKSVKQLVTHVNDIENVPTLVNSKNEIDRISSGKLNGIIATSYDGKFEINLLQNNRTVKYINENIDQHPKDKNISKVVKLLKKDKTELVSIATCTTMVAEVTKFTTFIVESIYGLRKLYKMKQEMRRQILREQSKAFERMQKSYYKKMDCIIKYGELKFEKKKLLEMKELKENLIKEKFEEEKRQMEKKLENEKRQRLISEKKNKEKLEEEKIQRLILEKTNENREIKEKIDNYKEIVDLIESQLVFRDFSNLEKAKRKMRKFEHKMEKLTNQYGRIY